MNDPNWQEIDENAPLLCLSVSHPKARLIIVPKTLHVEVHQCPNTWVRFWQRVLLGWRWEAIEQ